MKVNSTIYPVLLIVLLLSILFSCKKEVVPTVTVATVTNIAATSATSGGEITSDGGAAVIARGVCWSTNQNQTTADSKTTNGTGIGSFTSAITELTPGATYNLKAYAINAVGTAYSSPISFSTLALAPVLTTTDASAITSSSVNSGGNVTNDGGSPVTARGVCWSTSQNPTIADSKTTDGIGSGIFTSTITGLIPGSTYYFRAYATNSIGTTYGNQVIATTNATLPTITTTVVSVITATTATSGGNITNDGGASVTARGVCWSTSQTPTTANSKTTNGTGTGSFTSSILGLTPGTTYYVRAYATNSTGTGYGDAVSLTSSSVETLLACVQAYPNIIGEIVTTYLKGELVTCSKINGEYIYQGDIILVTPTKAASLVSQDSRWPDNKVYYTINSSFKNTDRVTDAIKEYENKTNITFQQRTNESNFVEFVYDANGCSSYIGMIGGRQKIRIADWGDAGTVIHEIGHAISLLHEQSKAGRDNYVTVITENIIHGMEHNFDEYSNSLNTPGFDFNSIMLYHSWGFSKDKNLPTMTKKDGTTFTPQTQHFTETDIYLINLIYPTTPKITTTAVSAITATTASSGGTITYDGGWHVIARGVCWGTSANPTIALSTKTTDGTGTGSFVSNLAGLQPGTLYYVRSYATNSIGTSYGNEISFTTLATVPTLTTTAASAITQTTATSGGNVTAAGGATVTAKGVCWSTSVNPTTTLSTKTTDGTGTGVFTSSITGLTASTTYYVLAYATNSIGTAYGTQVSFTTAPPDLPTGRITGIVRDASTSVSLSNVTVTVFMSTTSIATSSSQSDGRYEINVPGNTGYKVVFSKQGYLNAEYQNVNVTVGGNTVLEPVLQIDQNYSGNGNISGTIKNALDGTGIPSVSLKLRSGINVTSGNIIASTTTSSSGTYTFNGVPAGNYTIEASKSNFNTAYFTVICLGGRTVANQDATMSPILITGVTRIVLTWGVSPSDLDSHLTGPLADGTRFHMYFKYAEDRDGSPWPETVILDLDDLVSYGPETTTLLRQINGIYRFSVHDYSNRNLTNSSALSNSSAQVRVYQNSGLVATFNVPPNTGGTLWTVFEMSGSTISPINRMNYESVPSLVTKGGYINPDIALFRNLPQK